MTGHLVALSVSWEMEGYLGEVEVERERREGLAVFCKNGQDCLKRARFARRSMVARGWRDMVVVTIDLL